MRVSTCGVSSGFLAPRTSLHASTPSSVRPCVLHASMAPHKRVVFAQDVPEFHREGSASAAAILEEIPSSCEDTKSEDEVPSPERSQLGSRVVRVGGVNLRLGNGVQRVLSALVLAPLITYFLWRSPAFATTTVCTVVVSIASYEYAWIAHRIHTRFVFALEKFETPPDDNRSRNNSSARSSWCQSNGHTQPSSGQEQEMLPDPIQEDMTAARGKSCAVSAVAQKHLGGCEWLLAAMVATAGTALSTSLFNAVSSIEPFSHLDFGGFRLYYSIISSFAAWICACFSPDWRYATLLVVEKEIFAGLTLYSMKCPINNMSCDLSIHPSMFMLGGFMFITFFRLVSTKTPTELVFHLMLDIMGFVYIIGSLFFIVSFVDLDREATYRKLVIALLYVVWAADSGAYCFGKIMEACHFHQSHPLASHLSARKDYEGTFIAIFFGVGAMFLSSHLLHINGTVLEKLFFAAVAVIVGRVGDLFESLLKRAALVKDSGTLIPGHGGVLDRIDALMFASIVFSRYFGAIIFPDEH